jgi:transposase
VLEGLKREVSVSELCRREGIHAFVYYTWMKNFMEAGKSRLKGDFKRAANETQVEDLRRENGRLKMLLAENMLESELVKKSLLGEEPGR